MLKGISPLISPELLSVIARMGHGDTLAVVDRNYPAYASGREVLSAQGTTTTQLAEALFALFPVDTFIERPIARMEVVGEVAAYPEVQKEFVAAAEASEQRTIEVEPVERYAFYRRAAKAFAVVATSEVRPYGCFLVTKGVI